MRKKRKKEKWLSWLNFSRSYLLLAKLGCKELLDSERNKNEKLKDKEFFKMFYYTEDLFIAILYNIKHGIEIFIKTLKLILSEKIEKSHDIFYLFEVLEKEIKLHKEKIKSTIIKELNKSNLSDHDKVNLDEVKRNLDNLPTFLKKTKELVDKYYHCDVVKKKIKNDFIIEDIDNTVFRYPENNLKVRLDYQKILSRINKDDIKNIFQDIIDLLENFNNLGFILDIYKKYN